jgi:hypothetical protein
MILGIGIWNWIVAFSIVIPIFFILLSIPSFVYMVKIGKKNYLKNWKIIFQIKNGLRDCLLIKDTQQYNYKYPNGQTKTYTQTVEKYYYPIYKENGDIYIIQKNSGPFTSIWVIFNKKVGVTWVEDSHELKTSSCLYQQIYMDYIKKKLTKLEDNSKICKDINELEEVIYSELISKQRESKLEKILQ